MSERSSDVESPAVASGPIIKSVRAQGVWEGSMATAVRIRQFDLRSDEPVAVGGNDSAPTPMEIVAGAVNACTTVVIEQVAGELGISLTRIETETVAHQDVRGFRGTAEVAPHYLDYQLRIVIGTAASPELLDELRRQVEKRSPALSLIRAAGVPLELHWERC